MCIIIQVQVLPVCAVFTFTSCDCDNCMIVTINCVQFLLEMPGRLHTHYTVTITMASVPTCKPELNTFTLKCHFVSY